MSDMTPDYPAILARLRLLAEPVRREAQWSDVRNLLAALDSPDAPVLLGALCEPCAAVVNAGTLREFFGVPPAAYDPWEDCGEGVAVRRERGKVVEVRHTGPRAYFTLSRAIDRAERVTGVRFDRSLPCAWEKLDMGVGLVAAIRVREAP